MTFKSLTRWLSLSLLLACAATSYAQPISQGSAHRPELIPPSLEQHLPPIYQDSKALVEIKRKFQGSEQAAALQAYARQVINPKARARHIGMITLNYALTMASAFALKSASEDPGRAAMFLASNLPAIWFTADFLSGFVHKHLDSFASEKGPLGGAARAFRFHHEVPSGMNSNSYVENTGDTAEILTPFYALTAAAAGTGHLDPATGGSLLLLLTAIMNSQTFHAQAHAAKPSAFFGLLQRAGLSIGKKAHMRHHGAPFSEDYAAINGWSNPVTRKLWPMLDRIYWRALRKMPNNWIQDPRSIPPAVMEEINAGLAKIPDELLIYTMIYEERLPKDPAARRTLLDARDAWRSELVETRRLAYQALHESDPELAEELWRSEQLDNPWIYSKESDLWEEAP